jgi:uncharacterized membrane protein HdeD (DUF308 family)
MPQELARAWSILLIRGICNVLFALFAFLQPGLTLVALVLLWGAYAVVDGAMTLTTGVAARRSGGHHWSLVFAGGAGLVAGVVAWIWPGVTVLVLLAIIATWAIVRGALEIAGALLLRQMLPKAWLLVLAGVISIVFGVLLVVQPAIGLVNLVYLAAVAALTFGALTIALAFHLRKIATGLDGSALVSTY